MELISVIVPIYNVERYIETCLESICNQSYRNLQIILVNDGSPDNSVDICMKYMKKDNRIELVNKENGGLASARNAGLEKVRGEYIVCVDSDDWIESDMIKTLFENIKKYNADLAVCSFYEENQKGTKKEYFDEKVEVLSKEQALEKMIKPGKFYGFSWNKMYKRDILACQRYDESILKGEDSPFSCEYILKCNKIIYINSPLYHYRVDTVSISRSKFKNSKMTVLKSYAGIIYELKKAGIKQSLVKMQQVQYANQLLSLIVNIYKTDINGFKDEEKQILKEMKQYKKIYLESNEIDKKHKISYWIAINFKYLLIFACKIFN